MALAAFAATAVAAGPPAVQATDPNANSPAGAIYSIPLDNARQDAAPHGHAGGIAGGGSGPGGGGGLGGGGAAGGGGSGSAGGTTGGGTSGSGAGGGGGSSSSVSASRSSSTANGSGGTVLVPGGQPGSLVHSSNGFGSSSSVPGLNSPASVGFRAIQPNASNAPLYAILLAVAVMLVGAFVGSRSWYAARAQRQGAGGASDPPALPPPSSS
jgi:hypothetical protein